MNTTITIDNGTTTPTIDDDEGDFRPSCDWSAHPCNQVGTHVIIDNSFESHFNIYCPRHYVVAMAQVAHYLRRFPEDPPHRFGAFDE